MDRINKLRFQKEEQLKHEQLETRERLIKEAENSKYNPSPNLPATSKEFLQNV